MEKSLAEMTRNKTQLEYRKSEPKFQCKSSDTAQGVIGSRTSRKTLAMGVITDYFSTQDGKSVERQLVPLCVPLQSTVSL